MGVGGYTNGESLGISVILCSFNTETGESSPVRPVSCHGLLAPITVSILDKGSNLWVWP